MLSVVCPVFNEAETLRELRVRLIGALEPLGEFEVVLVDDGSTDGSWAILLELVGSDARFRAVRLSRNFGHQVALSAGLDAAIGEAVVTMDADLQDPPEMIPALVAKWREGYDVVYAIRESRDGDPAHRRLARRLGYKLISRLAKVDIPEQAGDFRLLSRRAADALAALPERTRYLRGMTSWIGFKQIGISHRRDARFAGKSKYPARKLIRLGLDGVTSFSSAPIRLVGSVGVAFFFFGLTYSVYSLYVRFFTEHHPAGWTTVVILVSLFGGVQLISLAIVGQYVARVFDEVKGRPLYVVDELVENELPASEAKPTTAIPS